jgi:hypothetical protein
MAIAPGFAATAMFAGLALGLAAPASAVNQMSGHYIETATSSAGRTVTTDWYFTPCGDGCASVADNGGPLGQARVVNGQWTLDTTTNAVCRDGSTVPNALSAHYTWDPNTLAGTAQGKANLPACGQPAAGQQTSNLQLRQAP